VESLIAAASAIRTGHRLSFIYEAHSKTISTREIEPYGLMHGDGRWYLIGHCIARKAMRTFRLDRATQLKICPNTFEPPSGFDARGYLAKNMPFAQSDYQIDVWIDMSFEEADRNFAPWRIASEPHNGGTRIRCGRDRLEMFAAMLLSTGRRIVVNTPPELRDTFRQLAQQATQAAESLTPIE
jgi:predicted DNA-binding transcriptional regulator YafY